MIFMGYVSFREGSFSDFNLPKKRNKPTVQRDLLLNDDRPRRVKTRSKTGQLHSYTPHILNIDTKNDGFWNHVSPASNMAIYFGYLCQFLIFAGCIGVICYFQYIPVAS